MQTTLEPPMPGPINAILTANPLADLDAPVVTLESITKQCGTFSAAHANLAAVLDEVNAMREAVRKEYSAKLKRAVAVAKAAKLDLVNMLEAAPHLFTRPKTVVLNDIKVGFKKKPDGISIPSEEGTMALVLEHKPEMAGIFIKSVQSLNKDALKPLTAEELEQLGCEVVKGRDEVVCVCTTSNVDKMVEALLKDEPEGRDDD